MFLSGTILTIDERKICNYYQKKYILKIRLGIYQQSYMRLTLTFINIVIISCQQLNIKKNNDIIEFLESH